MNAKIQQLMNRSFTDEQGERFDPERFAELIVRECAEVARQTILSGSGVDPDTFTGTVTTVQAIKKHFGVEE
jgi:NTP pyrophosphatase (non-canonical NTP hydrolase)